MSAIYWAVLRAALTVGGLSLLVKVVSLVKEGLVALRFGTAPELDAFLLAYAFPSFVLNVLTGALATAFVPVYVRLRATEGEARAAAFATTLSWQLVGALFFCALVLAPVCGALIHLSADSFDDRTMSVASLMLYALMPVVVLNGLSGFWAGFLNAQHRFVAAALTPLATPAVIVVTLVFFWRGWGAYAIVAGTLAGGLLEVALLAIVVRRSGLLFVPAPGAWRRLPPGLPSAFCQAAGSNVLIGATLLIDQSMAAMIAPGSVAALGYGTRVTGVVLGLGTMALATALLPHVSVLVAGQRFRELRALLRQYCLLTLAVAIPVTAVVIGASETIVRLLFERGSFGATDTALVSGVQIAYALQIPFFSLAMISVRVIVAMQANLVLLVSSAVSLVLDVLLNWILSRYFGVAGIALATSIVYFVACAFLWGVALWKLGILGRHAARRET